MQIRERLSIMKNAILIYLIAEVAKIEYTHAYIMGFIYEGMVYSYETTGLNVGVKLDVASRGQGYSLRYKPAKAEKKALIESGICKVVCTEEYFLELKKSSKYNKGEIFEKLVTEAMGLEWIP